MARGSARGGGGMVTGQIDTCIILCTHSFKVSNENQETSQNMSALTRNRIMLHQQDHDGKQAPF